MKQENPFPKEEAIVSNADMLKQVKFMQGRILTVIDATFPEGPQNKAFKDIIKNIISDHITFMAQMYYPEFPIITRTQFKATSLAEDFDEITVDGQTINVNEIIN